MGKKRNSTISWPGLKKSLLSAVVALLGAASLAVMHGGSSPSASAREEPGDRDGAGIVWKLSTEPESPSFVRQLVGGIASPDGWAPVHSAAARAALEEASRQSSWDSREVTDAALGAYSSWLSTVLSSELRSGIREQLLKFGLVRTVEVDARVARDDSHAGLAALLALSESERTLMFGETGLSFAEGGAWLARGGIGLRRATGHKVMFGVNAFYDWERNEDLRLSFVRTSVGAELWTSWVDLSANRYWGIDQPRTGADGEVYYSADGHDVVARGRFPGTDWAEWEFSRYRWSRLPGDAGADDSGYKAGVVLHLSKALELRLLHDRGKGGRKDFETQLRMRWDLVSDPLERKRLRELDEPWSRRYELVRRENRQKIFKRVVPETSTPEIPACTNDGTVAPGGTFSCSFSISQSAPTGQSTFQFFMRVVTINTAATSLPMTVEFNNVLTPVNPGVNQPVNLDLPYPDKGNFALSLITDDTPPSELELSWKLPVAGVSVQPTTVTFKYEELSQVMVRALVGFNEFGVYAHLDIPAGKDFTLTYQLERGDNSRSNISITIDKDDTFGVTKINAAVDDTAFNSITLSLVTTDLPPRLTFSADAKEIFKTVLSPELRSYAGVELAENVNHKISMPEPGEDPKLVDVTGEISEPVQFAPTLAFKLTGGNEELILSSELEKAECPSADIDDQMLYCYVLAERSTNFKVTLSQGHLPDAPVGELKLSLSVVKNALVVNPAKSEISVRLGARRAGVLTPQSVEELDGKFSFPISVTMVTDYGYGVENTNLNEPTGGSMRLYLSADTLTEYEVKINEDFLEKCPAEENNGCLQLKVPSSGSAELLVSLGASTKGVLTTRAAAYYGDASAGSITNNHDIFDGMQQTRLRDVGAVYYGLKLAEGAKMAIRRGESTTFNVFASLSVSGSPLQPSRGEVQVFVPTQEASSSAPANKYVISNATGDQCDYTDAAQPFVPCIFMVPSSGVLAVRVEAQEVNFDQILGFRVSAFNQNLLKSKTVEVQLKTGPYAGVELADQDANVVKQGEPVTVVALLSYLDNLPVQAATGKLTLMLSGGAAYGPGNDYVLVASASGTALSCGSGKCELDFSEGGSENGRLSVEIQVNSGHTLDDGDIVKVAVLGESIFSKESVEVTYNKQEIFLETTEIFQITLPEPEEDPKLVDIVGGVLGDPAQFSPTLAFKVTGGNEKLILSSQLDSASCPSSTPVAQGLYCYVLAESATKFTVQLSQGHQPDAMVGELKLSLSVVGNALTVSPAYSEFTVKLGARHAGVSTPLRVTPGPAGSFSITVTMITDFGNESLNEATGGSMRLYLSADTLTEYEVKIDEDFLGECAADENSPAKANEVCLSLTVSSSGSAELSVSLGDDTAGVLTVRATAYYGEQPAGSFIGYDVFADTQIIPLGTEGTVYYGLKLADGAPIELRPGESTTVNVLASLSVSGRALQPSRGEAFIEFPGRIASGPFDVNEYILSPAPLFDALGKVCNYTQGSSNFAVCIYSVPSSGVLAVRIEAEEVNSDQNFQFLVNIFEQRLESRSVEVQFKKSVNHAGIEKAEPGQSQLAEGSSIGLKVLLSKDLTRGVAGAVTLSLSSATDEYGKDYELLAEETANVSCTKEICSLNVPSSGELNLSFVALKDGKFDLSNYVTLSIVGSAIEGQELAEFNILNRAPDIALSTPQTTQLVMPEASGGSAMVEVTGTIDVPVQQYSPTLALRLIGGNDGLSLSNLDAAACPAGTPAVQGQALFCYELGAGAEQFTMTLSQGLLANAKVGEFALSLSVVNDALEVNPAKSNINFRLGARRAGISAQQSIEPSWIARSFLISVTMVTDFGGGITEQTDGKARLYLSADKFTGVRFNNAGLTDCGGDIPENETCLSLTVSSSGSAELIVDGVTKEGVLTVSAVAYYDNDPAGTITTNLGEFASKQEIILGSIYHGVKLAPGAQMTIRQGESTTFNVLASMSVSGGGWKESKADSTFNTSRLIIKQPDTGNFISTNTHKLSYDNGSKLCETPAIQGTAPPIWKCSVSVPTTGLEMRLAAVNVNVVETVTINFAQVIYQNQLESNSIEVVLTTTEKSAGIENVSFPDTLYEGDIVQLNVTLAIEGTTDGIDGVATLSLSSETEIYGMDYVLQTVGNDGKILACEKGLLCELELNIPPSGNLGLRFVSFKDDKYDEISKVTLTILGSAIATKKSVVLNILNKSELALQTPQTTQLDMPEASGGSAMVEITGTIYVPVQYTPTLALRLIGGNDSLSLSSLNSASCPPNTPEAQELYCYVLAESAADFTVTLSQEFLPEAPVGEFALSLSVMDSALSVNSENSNIKFRLGVRRAGVSVPQRVTPGPEGSFLITVTMITDYGDRNLNKAAGGGARLYLSAEKLTDPVVNLGTEKLNACGVDTPANEVCLSLTVSQTGSTELSVDLGASTESLLTVRAAAYHDNEPAVPSSAMADFTARR